jgi:GntR family phosphonate transport system transcriptional regulator
VDAALPELGEAFRFEQVQRILLTHFHMDDEWGISLRRGTTRLRARMPTLDECTQLTMSRGIPVMEVHTHNHCRDTGVLREYSIARSRSDLFEYSVEPKP